MPSVSDLGAHKYNILTGGLVLCDNSTFAIVLSFFLGDCIPHADAKHA